ncbi:uncharacterized protein PRCAT00002069001 [Priceomyces carsonii]|uniref:uncharacterized protein n=1 Tax=Priceomyces carsonii TaxID=28549 RepID=UPI002EDB2532|nr:unnamed protein product [Priceomyces carsonii]
MINSLDANLLFPQISLEGLPLENSYENIEYAMGQIYLKQSQTWGQHGTRERENTSSSFFLSPITSIDSTYQNTITPLIDEQLEIKEHFSPLLSLPIEILYQIIETVYYDDNTNSINSNLDSFSNTLPLLSKTLNQLSLRFLYKYAIFNRPQAFDKFLRVLLDSHGLGDYVEFIDFQTFTSIGLGRTGRMNQEIQMVTSKTIRQTLELTPNLIEFLASENIQDDLDCSVLDALFNGLPKIQALDFCGASSVSFAEAFQQLVIYDPHEEIAEDGTIIYKHSLDNLFKVSFHDCSNLAPEVFIKMFPHFVRLRRLDLNHTSVTSSLLNSYIPVTARFTHLSLARCSKLTTKDLIHFLVNHPAVSNDTLEWLNLQIDLNVVSPLNDVYLLYTLRHMKASNLKYLNIGGMPIDNRILKVIKQKFTKLESLSIGHASIDVNDINAFLENNSTIKFIDISGIKSFSRWSLSNLLKANFDSSLEAVEFDYKTVWELTGGESIKVLPLQQSFTEPVVEPQVWKFYDNEGRRAWLYKLSLFDPEYKAIVNSVRGLRIVNTNLTYYDLETGRKIQTKVTQPKFLKYASKKINCSIGYFNLNQCKKKRYLKNELKEDTWPVAFSQRGIYNYYSLNVR